MVLPSRRGRQFCKTILATFEYSFTTSFGTISGRHFCVSVVKKGQGDREEGRALAFTLANDQLKNKMQMVKLLLAYGADTAALRDPEAEAREEREQQQQGAGAARNSGRLSKVLEHLDPATR